MTALLLAVVCIIANGFFVAAEFGLAKVRPTSLEAMARTGDTKAARALGVANQLDRYLTASQFGITIASLALGRLGEPAVSSLLGPTIHRLPVSASTMHGISEGVAFTAITLAHIVVGELVPKLIAFRSPEQVSRWTSGPLRIFFFSMYPFLVMLNWVSNAISRALGVPASDIHDGIVSPQEIRVIVQRTFANDITDRRKDLIERALRATERPIRAVMVPRVDMVVMSVDYDLETALEIVRKNGYSRYPLCEEKDPDRAIGYVYMKDVLIGAARSERSTLRSLRRDILFVPETTTVGDLLTEFQQTHTPVAIVVDEYGGTSGFVTSEDIVEEIVGDIRDEHDVEEREPIERHEGGLVIVDGKVPIDELELEGLAIEPIEGADTVGGYVVAVLGRLAHAGDRVRLGLYDAVVEDVRRRRVTRVAFHPRTPTEPPPENHESPDDEPPSDEISNSG